MYKRKKNNKKNKIDRTELFENIPVNKALAIMSAPTIVSQLINLIYNVIDTIYIGRVGNAYMTAAVSVGYVIFTLTIAFSNLMGIGGGTTFSRLLGKKENKKARAVCACSLYGSLLIAIIFSLIVAIFMNPILYAVGASENTIEYARQYVIFVVVLGNIPVIVGTVTAHLLRNAGYSKLAGIGLSGGGLLNIILDPLFMFKIFPTGMEVTGAAVATLAANSISCMFLLIVMHRKAVESFLSVDIRIIKNLNRKDIQEIISVGIPSALLPGLLDIANMALNSLMAEYGDFQVAATGIVLRAERLSTAINMGICQGILPIISYNFTSGNHKRMNNVIKKARNLGLIISACTILLYSIFTKQICSAFLSTTNLSVSGESETLLYAVTFLKIRCLGAPVQMLNFNTSYCMQAVGYGKGALVHAVVREIVFYIPIMIFFSYFFGEKGIVSAFPISEILGAVFALFLFNK